MDLRTNWPEMLGYASKAFAEVEQERNCYRDSEADLCAYIGRESEPRPGDGDLMCEAIDIVTDGKGKPLSLTLDALEGLFRRVRGAARASLPTVDPETTVEGEVSDG